LTNMSQKHEKIWSVSEIRNLVDKGMPRCICGEILRAEGVQHYGPHDGGIHLEGYAEKRWVYIHCVCGYDMALWKVANEIKNNLENPEQLKKLEKEKNEMSDWSSTKIVKEERDHYSGIHCQHPDCETHPELMTIYWVDGIPIGRVCIKKGGWSRLDQAFQGRAF